MLYMCVCVCLCVCIPTSFVRNVILLLAVAKYLVEERTTNVKTNKGLQISKLYKAK